MPGTIWKQASKGIKDSSVPQYFIPPHLVLYHIKYLNINAQLINEQNELWESFLGIQPYLLTAQNLLSFTMLLMDLLICSFSALNNYWFLSEFSIFAWCLCNSSSSFFSSPQPSLFLDGLVKAVAHATILLHGCWEHSGTSGQVAILLYVTPKLLSACYLVKH